MGTKKDNILQMLSEGKTVNDIVNNGFSRKYVNEVIRTTKKNTSIMSQTKNKQYTSQDVSNNIKKLINYDIEELNINNEVKKTQIEEAIKMLQFILNNEKLLHYVSLSINIKVTDMDIKNELTKSEKSQNQIATLDNNERINPIEVYRKQGESILRDGLKNYNIAILKDIARQYTPDTRGYVYKWNDIDKIIDYIVKRASNLSEKGSVFVSDSQ